MQQAALVAAGIIGAGVAVVHGFLMQRMIIRRLDSVMASEGIPVATRRLVPALLHFSTASWLLSSLLLSAAALWSGHDVIVVASLVAGAAYLYGAVAAAWSIRNWHPSWLLMTLALALIVLGLM